MIYKCQDVYTLMLIATLTHKAEFVSPRNDTKGDFLSDSRAKLDPRLFLFDFQNRQKLLKETLAKDDLILEQKINC